MYKIYDEWPHLAKKTYETYDRPINFDGIDHIIFAGMGGSGAIGDIFSSILSKTNIHVCVVKGYLLPKTVDANTLVVTTSMSGNTSETMSVLNSANKINCKLMGFSSGGLMEQYCKKHKIDHRKISLFHSPRSSFMPVFYYMLKVLEPILPIQKKDVIESILELEKLQKKIFSGNLTDTNPSLKLAGWISDIPLIYYPHGLQAAAIRFKNSLQENSKIHAMTEDIIEACHNSIVSWEKPSSVKPILIRGDNDYIRTKERWEIVKEFFKMNGIDYHEIKSIKGNIISKLTTLIYLLDYSSIYLAALSKVDPSPVQPIDYIKSRLTAYDKP